MTGPVEEDTQFDIAHVLCTDIVGYSKLTIDQQSERLRSLNDIVRSTESFKRADAAGKLLRIPTGDGMVLVFFTHPQDPAECAVQIAKGLKAYPEIALRMGVHSGPVNRVSDVNERSNVAGAGINMGQRVMDCGDAGHILVSKRVAEDLAHYSKWQPHLHPLGECEVKHGVKVDIVNLYTDDVGNPALPSKLKESKTGSRSQIGKLLITAAALLAITVVSLWLVWHRGPRDVFAAPAPEKSVAIFPFKPLSSQNRDEVLENGMADTLISKLSTIAEVIIPSLSSAQKSNEQEHDVVAAGRLLHVRSVLDGTLQRVADRIRVSARLIDVRDGRSMWSDTFDEKFTDVFAVQDAIAQKVARAMALRLNADQQQRLTKRYTDNADAYQLYVKGRFYWNKYTQEGFTKSIDFYNQALALDPNYALAYAGLADSYGQLGDNGFEPPEKNFPLARKYAEKALTLDDKLPQSHVALGTCLLFYDWNWAEAEKELKRGIELNPSYADAYHFYDHYLESQGRVDEAIAAIKRAVELDPLSLIINNEVGWAYYHGHKFDPAIEQLRKTLEMDPNFFVTVQNLAQAYEAIGKPAVAVDLVQKALAPSQNWSGLVAELGCAYAALGNNAGAQEVIAQLKQRSTTEFIDPYLLAVIYAHLGDRDHAFEWLDKAIAVRSTFMIWFKVEPKFDPLRSDPRFPKLLGRMGLQ